MNVTRPSNTNQHWIPTNKLTTRSTARCAWSWYGTLKHWQCTKNHTRHFSVTSVRRTSLCSRPFISTTSTSIIPPSLLPAPTVRQLLPVWSASSDMSGNTLVTSHFSALIARKDSDLTLTLWSTRKNTLKRIHSFAGNVARNSDTVWLWRGTSSEYITLVNP